MAQKKKLRELLEAGDLNLLPQTPYERHLQGQRGKVGLLRRCRR